MHQSPLTIPTSGSSNMLFDRKPSFSTQPLYPDTNFAIKPHYD